MDEPEGTETSSENSEGESPPTQVDRENHNANSGHNNGVGHAEENDPDHPPKKWKDIGFDRKIELVLGAVIVVSSISQLVITWSNNESTGRQVDKIIVAAGGIEDSSTQMKNAAWDFKGSAQGIDGNFGKAVTKLQVQAEEIDRARAASEQQSRKSLQAAIDNFHQEQRAWVGFSGFNVQPDPVNNMPLVKGHPEMHMSVSVAALLNSGRTPARNVRAVVGLGFKDPFHVLNASDEVWMNTIIQGIGNRRTTPDPQSGYFSQGNLKSKYQVTSPNLGQVTIESIVLGVIPQTLPSHTFILQTGSVILSILSPGPHPLARIIHESA
jgi:hypothetical protein